MNQFLDPSPKKLNLDDSGDQEMGEDDGPNFGKDLQKQMEAPLNDTLINKIDKIGSGKILPPQLNRGYSFSKPDSEVGYSDPSMKNIFSGLNCK